MDKKTAGLIGAIAGLATMGSVQAVAQPAASQPVSSYSDLLAPISNATELLRADDAARLQQSSNRGEESTSGVVRAEWYYQDHHHHHHHHHHHYRHYHHHSAYFAAPAGTQGTMKKTA